MSDPVSALNGASFQGFASIREIGPIGMITLRAKGLKSLDKAIKSVTGTKTPAQRRIEVNGDRACGWMSPDEYLLILPYAGVADALAKLAKSLSGEHHLAVDVSDARAVFRIEGDKAADVLRKLFPVDFEVLEPGEMRRSRAAQVPAALWKQDQGFTLVCFRSVATYVMGLLTHSAQPGSEI
ncbi:MAG: sarcosine oxidase subunit gamma [Rhodobacteraceae bacterium]|nr:MAG: sarcosine oxidase subunit gamma [Paracoccaceae bacterium]